MSAYAISDVEVLDRELMEQYRLLAKDSIARHGGGYLARGGAIESVEGGWNPKDLIIAEFPDMERAPAWYHSHEYAAALRIRPQALHRKLIFVEGPASA